MQLKIPKLRWSVFRFSLQSLLLLMAVVALSVAWWSDHRRLSQQLYALQNPIRAWDSNQVLGPPDTPGAGDIATAWASATPDGQDEWLLLEYERAVVPSAIFIHETYNPGAVSKVTLFNVFGAEVVAWSGTDPTPSTSARGISVIPVTPSIKTRRIKVYLDSMANPGWNEIDAVGLRYGNNKTLWAKRATASSTYGSNKGLVFGGVRFTR